MTDRRHRAYIAAKPNVLELIYNENIHDNCDIDPLRSNPNLSVAMIKKVFAYPVFASATPAYLSRNPATTLEFARANQQLDWDWQAMQGNPNVTMDDLSKWPGELDFSRISYNPNLTPEFYWQHGEEHDWSYYLITFNRRFNPEFFVNKPDCISLCVNITLDFIAKNPHLIYCWYSVFQNLKPDQDFLRYAEINNAYYHLPVNSDDSYVGIYAFAQLTPAFIDEIFERWPRLKQHIDYYSMSFNEHLSLADMEEIEKKHPARRGGHFRACWNLDQIAQRGDIMPEDILKSPLFTAQYSEEKLLNAISRNPNITVDFVRKNKKYIDLYQFYRNLFLWDKNAYKISLARDIAERQSVVYAAAREIFGEFARVIKKFIDYQ